ncbi:hypothetical protein AVEN_46222-1 [Araneus ventricosus]|uniref:Uncharacterized protein n=1 Tax=Araneus ventricosus TaxID=182803 RepID=A0A4Y2J7U7_ARAVE|nr:hypothetical protein AVEN_46222-1 [Araneus ventricosus]
MTHFSSKYFGFPFLLTFVTYLLTGPRIYEIQRATEIAPTSCNTFQTSLDHGIMSILKNSSRIFYIRGNYGEACHNILSTDRGGWKMESSQDRSATLSAIEWSHKVRFIVIKLRNAMDEMGDSPI